MSIQHLTDFARAGYEFLIASASILKSPFLLVSDAGFLFLLASVSVFIFGPGVISVDALIKRFFLMPRKKGAAIYDEVRNPA